MYEVDDQDVVKALEDLPQSSVGAPLPVVLATEHQVLVLYLGPDRAGGWDGTSIRVVGIGDEGPVATVTFTGCLSHRFGPPNDEAFLGHPLASRGLRPYGSYEVLNSSWIRRLELMNAVHPHHDKDSFLEGKRHIVLSFHDTTFECIANGYSGEVEIGSIASVLSRVTQDLLG